MTAIDDTIERMGAVTFYVVAHQDDWQIFAGDRAWEDIASGATVVFVYTTAGDAGRRDGWWEAREAGAIASCRLVTGPTPQRREVRSINGHAITCVHLANTRSYFLRLPDGGLDDFRTEPGAVVAVDDSTWYRDWRAFVTTLGQLVEVERRLAGDAHPRIAGPSFDRRANPGDHGDHHATGCAIRDVAAGVCDQVYWMGYDCASRPPNTAPDAFARRQRLTRAYSDGVLAATTAAGAPCTDYVDLYERYMERHYPVAVPWDHRA